MGCWSDYCLICGGPYRNEGYDDNGDSVEYDDCEWLVKSYTITKDNKLHRTGVVDCGMSESDGNEFCVCKMLWEDYSEEAQAIACHRSCYKLLKKEFAYKLKFEDVYDMIDEYLCVLNDKSVYGEINEYSFGQEFESAAFVKDRWLLQDPLIDTINRKRIFNIWKPLIKKFKKN